MKKILKLLAPILALATLITAQAFAENSTSASTSDDDFKVIGRKINLSGITDKIESMTLLPNGSIKTGFRATIKGDGENFKEAIDVVISTKLFDIKVDKNFSVEVLPFEVTVEGYLNDPHVTIDAVKASLAKLVFSPIGLSGQIITYLSKDTIDKYTYRGIDFVTVNYSKAVNLSEKNNLKFVFSGSASIGVGRFYKPDDKTIDAYVAGVTGKVGITIPNKMLIEFYDSMRTYFGMQTYTHSVLDAQQLARDYVIKQNLGINFAYFINDWLKLIANFDIEMKFDQIQAYSGMIGIEILF